jgi:tetratricopeptide (TPR) repeat protein
LWRNSHPKKKRHVNVFLSPWPCLRPSLTLSSDQALLSESNEKKTQANALFSSAKYETAIDRYEEAAAVCPHYLDYEIAVLQSNISACHLKLEQWKEAIGSATKSIEGLDRTERAEAEAAKRDKEQNDAEDDVEEEIISSGAEKSAPAPEVEDEAEKARRKRREDTLRIRAKALMRRARARSELGGWANLSGAEEDYKLLAKMTNLSSADRKLVQSQLRVLPPRTKAAQEHEMSEMWGKLKDVSTVVWNTKASTNLHLARERNLETLWPQYGQLWHGEG